MEDETTTITVEVKPITIYGRLMYKATYFDKGVQYKVELATEDEYLASIPFEAIEAFRKAQEDNPE